jgi:hypothetical protein
MPTKAKAAADPYAEFNVPAGDNILSQIAVEAQKQLDAEAVVARLTEDLKKAQETLRHIQEHTLPNLMDAASQRSCTTRAGVKVEVTEVLRGSIPQASEVAAFQWLEDAQSGALIKRQITIEFSKGEEAWANKFMADLARRKRPVQSKFKRAVHPQTLQAYLREQLAAGVEVPLAIFGVFRQRFSKVTAPK